MILIIALITFFYCILIIGFIIGFDKVEVFNEHDSIEKTKFSIIIPFRNEAENLSGLLQSLSKLNYQQILFEILFVDDASEDNSVEIINTFINQQQLESTQIDIKILKNKRTSNSPKKEAITTAIHFSKHEWIITTDADCVVPKLWLKTLDLFIQTNKPKMIIAPVTYTVNNSFFEHFQLLDFLSLQSATIAGFGIKNPFMCNGANLSYRKDFFTSLNGFVGNAKIASGDDIFLMEKALNNDFKKVMYLKSKNALITTKPQSSFRDLIQQRLRWAAKTTSYENTFGKFVGLTILAMNTAINTSLFLFIIGVLKFEFLILLVTLKFFLDLVLIHKSARFFNQKVNLLFYFISSLLYPFFSVYIAVRSMFFGFKWKDRNFKK